jgi:anti-sigma regulatory factor (Ser/Thr protein kinase)
VTQAALRTHPVRSTSDTRLPSNGYASGGHVAAFAERLPARGDAVLRGAYGPGDVAATRRTVAQWARSCGLPEERVEVLELAASELATNSIQHGGGTGTLAMWLDETAAVVEFSDTGILTDPLTGRRTPSLEQQGGRGLYLVNQLCDLVQLRSSEDGTTVRVITWF